MKIELNQCQPYFRRSMSYLRNLFDGFEFVTINEMGHDEERCWLNITTDLGDFNFSDKAIDFSKYKIEKYIEILTLLEDDIRGLISEVCEF